MRIGTCCGADLKRIGIFVTGLALFIGTLDSVISGGNLNGFLRSVVFTLICAFFCALVLCASMGVISGFPRVLFYTVFSIEVTACVFLGITSGHLIMDGGIALRPPEIIFSLLFGLASSGVMTAYMFFRGSQEMKIARIKEVELENERLKRLNTEARLNELRAKLNPHFLFNALNTTASLIPENPEKAEQSLVRLANLYRRVLAGADRDMVSVGEEMDLIADFLDLEKLRYDDRLTYRLDVPEAVRSRRIPALLVQPLVENAVRHSRSRSSRPLEVSVLCREDHVRFEISVSDTGPGFDPARVSIGHGLYGIQERLRLKYGRNAGMKIHSRIGSGTEILLWFSGEEKR